MTHALPHDIIEVLDAWMASPPQPQPSRDEAIAYALRDWLTCLGLLPFHDAPEQAN